MKAEATDDILDVSSSMPPSLSNLSLTQLGATEGTSTSTSNDALCTDIWNVLINKGSHNKCNSQISYDELQTYLLECGLECSDDLCIVANEQEYVEKICSFLKHPIHGYALRKFKSLAKLVTAEEKA